MSVLLLFLNLRVLKVRKLFLCVSSIEMYSYVCRSIIFIIITGLNNLIQWRICYFVRYFVFLIRKVWYF